ncbi:hypothetical protein H2200_007161 [Cladophialophora chaetospira]|uniref:Dienelactone hydrolase domain-containing protein n=1 Tax=Cladophialophora chaetospira TaxID=386627 RepID=A0AA39CHD5_9EURO|nr:hypothetical protein H2200_007161 [Cladophialophora chaetospira]
MGDCCLKGFQWEGEPKGKESVLANRSCYVTGSKSDAGIMVIHDLFGWTLRNIRVLADHYADEVGATVYVPDFFGGEVLPADILKKDPSGWKELNLPAFIARNTKAIRTPEILECARILRSRYKYTGAIGFCFGGWAVFRLGARDNGERLVDCISTAHPTWLTKEEIKNVGVPVQILAPEHDGEFTPELKAFANSTIPTLGVAYDYQYFPGLEHVFAVRGDLNKPAEREGLERAKNVAVFWFRQWLR